MAERRVVVWPLCVALGCACECPGRFSRASGAAATSGAEAANICLRVNLGMPKS